MRRLSSLLGITLVAAILVGCASNAIDPNDPSLKKNAGKPSIGGGGAGGPAKGGPSGGTEN
jgi:hypothetical protein